MSATTRRSNSKARRTAAVVLGALALAVPVSSAGAATNPFSFWSGAATPFAYPSFSAASFPIAQQGSVGGAVLSQPIAGTTTVTGCGESRQELLGSGSTLSNTSCYSLLSFIGPSIGQVNSQVGPTIIGSVILAPITVSAGPVVNTVP